MADDVEITAGSGTIIKTDQVGTDHVQYVKLMDGTADSAAVVAGDSSLTALMVRPRRVFNKTSATGSGRTHPLTQGWRRTRCPSARVRPTSG